MSVETESKLFFFFFFFVLFTWAAEASDFVNFLHPFCSIGSEMHSSTEAEFASFTDGHHSILSLVIFQSYFPLFIPNTICFTS